MLPQRPEYVGLELVMMVFIAADGNMNIVLTMIVDAVVGAGPVVDFVVDVWLWLMSKSNLKHAVLFS
jgi:hypothetical protein